MLQLDLRGELLDTSSPINIFLQAWLCPFPMTRELYRIGFESRWTPAVSFHI